MHSSRSMPDGLVFMLASLFHSNFQPGSSRPGTAASIIGQVTDQSGAVLPA
jgi:hypothetical protein